MHGRQLFSLEKLHGSIATWTDTKAISRAYAQSLALVDHIQRWYGERVLFEMVERAGRGSACEQTFRERAGVELHTVLADLEADL